MSFGVVFASGTLDGLVVVPCEGQAEAESLVRPGATVLVEQGCDGEWYFPGEGVPRMREDLKWFGFCNVMYRATPEDFRAGGAVPVRAWSPA